MTWKNCLDQLEAAPADADIWEGFEEFCAEATRIADAKRHQRESARADVEAALSSLREREIATLAPLGWPDLSRWQSQVCSAAQALRLMPQLERFERLLARYQEARHQIPATPQEFQALRRARNALEDDILALGAALAAFFADPQAGIPASLLPESVISPQIADFAISAVENLAPDASQLAPDASQLAPEASQLAPEASQLAPEASQLAPEASQLAPEASQLAPEASQLAPEASQLAPEASQLAPEASQLAPEASQLAPEASQLAPEASQLAPDASQLAPDASQLAPDASRVSNIEEFQAEIMEVETIDAALKLASLQSSLAAASSNNWASQSASAELAPPPQEASRKLKIFISSPGDVGQERVVAMRVVDRLQNEFAAYLDLEPILWEHEPLRATSHFQDQILAPSLSNIVICILWSRLGTRLPAKYSRPDGSLYASGTEWEFEDALSSYKERGTPDLMVYRKSAEPHASMSDEKALLDRLAQKRALDSFIDRWFGNPQESFKAAFHQFSSPDEFEQVLESHLRKLIGERLPANITEDGASAPIRWHQGSPFRGLQDFDPQHAPVFFGRTRAISEAGSNLAARAAGGCAFLVVFGMSGSGKSSMVKAGLLPTLTQPGVVEGVGLWRYALTTPGAAHDPIFGLANALLQPGALPELQAQGLDALELAGLLREAPQRVIGPLRAALKTTAEATAQQENLHQIPVARLAIVVDQLEEIFTQEGLEAEERRRFIAVLQTLAQSGIVWVMATMRSDFFVRCAEIPELMQLKEGLGQYHLLPPTSAELSQILTQPARSAGLRFEVDPSSGERLSDVLQDAAGKDAGALPLLEFTLDELFKKRTPQGVLTFEALRELGGIEGALGRRAEEVFVGLPLDVQAELPAMLRALVTVSEEEGGGDVHVGARRARLSQLAQNPARLKLVEAFVAARLLVSDHLEILPPETISGADAALSKAPSNEIVPVEESIVRIAHEALLRHWPRLQKWLSDDLDFLRTRARVTSNAAQWNTNHNLPEYLLRQGRPLFEAEELLLHRQGELEPATVHYIRESRRVVRRARNLRLGMVTGVIVAFICVVSGFGAFSFMQWKKTEVQKKMALSAVNKWTYDVPEKLAGIPATRPALKVIFEENIKLLDDISALDPQTSGVKREKAANLDRMGDTWALLGDSGQAKSSYEQSLAILTGLEQTEATPARRRDLATSLEKIGDTRQTAGDLKGAKTALAQSLSLRQALAQNGFDAAIERELSVSYEKMGGLQRALKDFAGSQANLKRAWDIRSKLAQNPADSPAQRAAAQRDLFVCAVSIGDAYLDEGKTESARATFERSLPLARERAKTGSPEARRDLAALYDRLGDVQVSVEKPAAALAFYRQSLAIARDLARSDADAPAQRDLLTSWERIGNLQLNSGDPRAALASFAQALPLAQNLARDADNLEAQQGLLDSYVEIGDVQLQMGALMLANAAYQRALRQYEAIAQKWPRDAHSRAQAAAANGQLAYLKLQFRRPQEAIAAALKGLELAPEQSWITVNLVEAYLFSNQLPQAQALCLKNRAVKVGEKSFYQAVLADMSELKSADLTNANVIKLRAWLLKL